jgi:hypothetical protein
MTPPPPRVHQVPPGKRGLVLAQQYLALAATHPPHLRMAKGHIHKMAGPWLAEFTDLRDALNRGGRDLAGLAALVRGEGWGWGGGEGGRRGGVPRAGAVGYMRASGLPGGGGGEPRGRALG